MPLLLRLVPAALMTLLVAVEAAALNPRTPVERYSFHTWQIEDGLPQNSVNAVVQTADGYLWIGTQEGLARFDGSRFTVYDRANTPELRSNHVQDLLQARDGTLWIGTFGGGVTHYRDGRFTALPSPLGVAAGNEVRTLYEDRHGVVWVGTNGGVTRHEAGITTTLTTANGLASNEVMAIHQDAGGAIWIGTYGGGLNRIDRGNVLRYTVSDGLADDRVLALWTSPSGEMWIGTRNGVTIEREHRFSPFQAGHLLPNAVVHDIVGDRDGNVWLATRGGVARWSGGRLESAPAPLADELARAIYEDAERNLWVGTYGGGLFRIKDRLIETLTRADGLSEDVIRSIDEDEQGGVWIGTYGSGVNYLRDGALTTMRSGDGLTHERVWSTATGPDGSVWLGTFGGGVNRLAGGKVTSYTQKEGLAGDLVRVVYRARDGAIWIGTNSGLSRFDGSKFINYTKAAGLPDDKVTAILQRADGTLWVGTSNGVAALRDGRFTPVRLGRKAGESLVYALYEDAEGLLWIGTNGGLLRLKGNVVTAFTTEHGLFNPYVFHILEDDDHYLWMSSAKGIFRVPRQELDDFAEGRRKFFTSISFGKADGMKSSECNGGFQPAGCRTRDGRLWFPTTKGIATVDPRGIQLNKRPPPIVIDQLVVDGKEQRRDGELLLPPDARDLEIRYAALTFVAPEKAKFKYRLEGFDTEWVDAGHRRVAWYTNLPPGRYRFHVAGCNNDGVWNEKGAGLTFRIAPHFYETWWFYALLGLCALAMAFVAYRLRVRHMLRREQELLELVDERTRMIAAEHAAAVTAAEQIEHLAYYDTLTGLPNRSLFLDRLIECAAFSRPDGTFAILLLDVDRFKEINDSLGHSTGDSLLRFLAERIRRVTGKSDVIARFGGDEFAVLLADGGTAEATALADRLLEAVRLPLKLGEQEIFVTASIGVSVFPDDGDDVESLLKNADVAMYRAKELGRDNVQTYHASMNATAAERLALENALRRALEQEQLLLHYQPIIDSESEQIVAAEALLRWRHPELGLLSPADFLRTAEVSGLIVPIGAWVLRRACMDARRWHDAGFALRVAVNLSARQFEQRDLVEQIQAALEGSGLRASFLELEITESEAMQRPDETVEIIERIKALGVEVAIDDFGTGYSSLNYLSRFRVDSLKLDQSFVRDVETDAQDRAIASAVIAMAHSLGMRVVGEGVENSRQRMFLQEHSCDLVQGFLFSRPVAFEEFEQILHEARSLLQ